jgi:HEAT repeat protein
VAFDSALAIALFALQFSGGVTPTRADRALSMNRIHVVSKIDASKLRERALQGLQHAWPIVRAHAICALGQLDDVRDFEALWEMRNDQDARVRTEVVMAIRNGRRLEAELARRESEPPPWLAARVEELYNRVNEPLTAEDTAQVRTEIAALRRDVDGLYAGDGCAAFAKLDSPDQSLQTRILAFLVEHAHNFVSGTDLPFKSCCITRSWASDFDAALTEFVQRYPGVTVNALKLGQENAALIFAMGEANRVEFRPLLRQSLKSTNADIRATAACVAGQLGNLESIPSLYSLARSRMTGVALATCTSLRILVGDQALTSIVGFLSKVDVEKLYQILNEIQPTTAIVRALLQSSSADRRIEVAGWVIQQENPSPELLSQLRNDPDRRVREAVDAELVDSDRCSALSELGGGKQVGIK